LGFCSALKSFLGSIALWKSEVGLAEDEVLYKVWANEEIPHPKVEEPWTVQRAKQWVGDYIKLVYQKYTIEVITGPRKAEGLKDTSQVAKHKQQQKTLKTTGASPGKMPLDQGIKNRAPGRV